MEFIALPIGHAGTTLNKTLDNLTAAFSTFNPHVEQASANTGVTDPAAGHNAKIHDSNLFKLLLDSLKDLAQPRLVGIIRNKKRLEDALPKEDNHHRTDSVASPKPTHAAQQEGVAPHTYA